MSYSATAVPKKAPTPPHIKKPKHPPPMPPIPYPPNSPNSIPSATTKNTNPTGYSPSTTQYLETYDAQPGRSVYFQQDFFRQTPFKRHHHRHLSSSVLPGYVRDPEGPPSPPVPYIPPVNNGGPPAQYPPPQPSKGAKK